MSALLYQLIHSLSPQEKRHFRLFSQKYHSRKREKYYQEVFKAFANAPAYDEKAIKKKLHPAPYLRQFHVIKNYLLNSLMESLQTYSGANDPEEQVADLLQKSRICEEKGHSELALKWLKKAEKTARTYEKFNLLLTIYHRQKYLYIRKVDVANMEAHIQQFQQLEREALRQLEELKQAEWASMEFFALYYRYVQPRNKQEVALFKEKMTSKIFSLSDSFSSVRANIVRLNTLGLQQEIQKNRQATLLVRSELVALYQTHPHFIRENFQNYVASLNNLILTYFHLQDYPLARRMIEKMKNAPQLVKTALKKEEKVNWYRMTSAMELELFIRTGDFLSAEALIPEVEQQWEMFGAHLGIQYRFPFFYFFAYSLFALEKYAEALTYLDPLMDAKNLTFKTELFRFGKLLQLICHFELGNYDLLPSLIRSTSRSLQQSGTFYEVEQLLLEMLRKVPPPVPSTFFQHYYQQFSELAETKQYGMVLHHFHFPAWLFGKWKKRSFISVYKEGVQSPEE
jgi:hypothetical protein